jgi:diguanylate cyclase
VTSISGRRPPVAADVRLRPTRTLRSPGRVGRPRPARILVGLVVAAAVAVGTLGAVLPLGAPGDHRLPVAARIGVAVVLFAAGQLGRLRFRVGRGAVSVSWGEAAFLLAYPLAPTGWLPAAAFAGSVAASLVSWRLDLRARLGELVQVAAPQTLGAAAAAAAAYGVDRARGGAGPLGLLAGAGTYLAVTLALAVATLWMDRDSGLRHVVARILHAKVPMFVGNVLVALTALGTVRRAPIWLPMFVPALWLLQRTYRYHLRAAEERRIWTAFARATGSFGRAGQREVAEAGLRGALDVFGAHGAELRLVGRNGDRPRYGAGEQLGEPVARELTVGGAPVGALTLWQSEPVLDGPVLEAYAAAVAGALHDAAGQDRLAGLEARIAYEARHDGLTGLANRAALVQDGDSLLGSVDKDRHVGLLLLDLNDFREVNGTLGQHAGDAVLRRVAERLTDLIRDDELIARLGDDEFAMLVPNVALLTDSATPLQDVPSPMPQALRRARELVEQIGAPIEVGGVRLVTEAAVGVVVSRAGHADVAELIRRAGVALHHAKQMRVTVAPYDSAREATSTDHLAILGELREALVADDQLVLALQPAVDLETSTPTGVEALIRWRHPRRGQLAPGEFIRTVEHSELLARFTAYVLDRAVAAAADWVAAGLDLPVSVNVSARSLLDAAFPAQVGEALRRHGLPASRLVLEITETVAVSEHALVDSVLAALREVGVQLSVDDFGTGFSSLSFVTRVPVDELKVDRSFVEDMIESPAAAAVVRGAVELGSRLGVRVVAEGVETADQRAALLALGCTAAQGYHFCQPQPPDRIVLALRALGGGAPGRIRPLRPEEDRGQTG